MLDLRHIRHFLAAAAHATVQDAADALCITQPALTKSLARFEDELDAKLFDRRGRRLELTDLGERLVKRGEDLLRHVSEVEEEVDLWKGLGVGEVAIGVDAEVELSLLPPVLGNFVPEHPGVHVTVRSGHTDTLLPALHAGDLHFIVADSELAVEHHDLEIRRLAADPIAAAVRPGHPLEKNEEVTPAEMMSHPVAGAFTAPRYERFTAEQSRILGVKPLIASLVSDNYEVLVRLGESSNTIVIGPRSLLSTYVASGRLVVTDWPLDGPHTSPSIIYSRDRYFSPAAERMMQLFQDESLGSGYSPDISNNK